LANNVHQHSSYGHLPSQAAKRKATLNFFLRNRYMLTGMQYRVGKSIVADRKNQQQLVNYFTKESKHNRRNVAPITRPPSCFL
jgi:hypothetical protein